MYLLHRPICCQTTLSAQSFNGSLLFITTSNSRETTLCALQAALYVYKLISCLWPRTISSDYSDRSDKSPGGSKILPFQNDAGLSAPGNLRTLAMGAHFPLICLEQTVWWVCWRWILFLFFNISRKLAFSELFTDQSIWALVKNVQRRVFRTPFALIKECAWKR